MSERRALQEERPQLSPEALTTLGALLDTIIPPSKDGRLPGAGAIGGADRIARAMQLDAALAEVVVAGLDALDAAAGRNGASRFADLEDGARAAVLAGFQAERKEFFERIVLHACTGYYQHERVVASLGLEARPPFPKGYEVAGSDPALLEPVKKRAPMYREC